MSEDEDRECFATWANSKPNDTSRFGIWKAAVENERIRSAEALRDATRKFGERVVELELERNNLHVETTEMLLEPKGMYAHDRERT